MIKRLGPMSETTIKRNFLGKIAKPWKFYFSLLFRLIQMQKKSLFDIGVTIVTMVTSRSYHHDIKQRHVSNNNKTKKLFFRLVLILNHENSNIVYDIGKDRV